MRGGGRGEKTSGRGDSGEEGVEEQSCETSADPGLLSADLPTDNGNQHSHVSISLSLSLPFTLPFLPQLFIYCLEHQIYLQVLQRNNSAYGWS